VTDYIVYGGWLVVITRMHQKCLRP